MFPSRYLFAIGLAAYLALDVPATRSRCTTRQRYSVPAPRSGAVTRCGAAFQRLARSAPQRPRAFHWGSSSFGRPYYRNPCLFLLLALVICLSPGRARARRAPLEPRAVLPAYRMLSRSSSSGEPTDPIQEVSSFRSCVPLPSRAANATAVRLPKRGNRAVSPWCATPFGPVTDS